MDPRFNDIFTSPENQVFQVVFYPDRVYHAQYLNATRSDRYRYNVREVRGKIDILALKGEVYLDGLFLTNFVRLEYRPTRLVEQAREQSRFVRGELLAWIKFELRDNPGTGEAIVKMHYDRWIGAYQVEIWDTLEAPAGSRHDYRVLDQMGGDGSITRVPSLSPLMADLSAIRRISTAFRENDRDLPYGYRIADDQAAWDNNFTSSHQEPRTQVPSDSANTIPDKNYLLDFQRGFFVPNARNIAPVRYRNGMMDTDNPDRRDDNVIEMRWVEQRELGTSVVFFHEVTIPPHTVEGTHRHIGSEELYYIFEGQGLAYMGANDDPTTSQYPTVDREIYGLGTKTCRQLPVAPGSVIYTKSGGIHGIENPNDAPLRFVAFLYHSA
jgi:mannose-6-phosphate isomerase-like protein (cupin superfamily)